MATGVAVAVTPLTVVMAITMPVVSVVTVFVAGVTNVIAVQGVSLVASVVVVVVIVVRAAGEHWEKQQRGGDRERSHRSSDSSLS